MAEAAKPERKKHRKRGWLILFGMLAILLCAGALGFVLRVEGYVQGHGYVTAHKDPLLRASQKGPIAQILVKNDQQVTAGQLIKLLNQADAIHFLPINSQRDTFFKANLHIARLVRGFGRGPGPGKYLLRWLNPGVLENPALNALSPEVLVN